MLSRQALNVVATAAGRLAPVEMQEPVAVAWNLCRSLAQQAEQPHQPQQGVEAQPTSNDRAHEAESAGVLASVGDDFVAGPPVQSVRERHYVSPDSAKVAPSQVAEEHTEVVKETDNTMDAPENQGGG